MAQIRVKVPKKDEYVFAMIDSDMIEILNKKPWFLHNGYAKGKFDNKQTSMHRAVIKAANGQAVDHIDNNRLNNKRENLRIVSKSLNAQNRQKKWVELRFI